MPSETLTIGAPQTAIRSGGCAGCTLCCKLMGVRSLGKPANTWCQHCLTGKGCGIYESRPVECANFVCGFLSMPALGEEWRPATSRLILDTQTTEGTMYVHVDPARPDAWRRSPYYAALKAWAGRALPTSGRVIVRVGTRSIVVLPDHAVDLGAVQPDEVIVILSGRAQSGPAAAAEAYAANAATWQRVGREIQQGTQVPPLADGFRQGRRLD